MIAHECLHPTRPARVVLLGATGVIGRAVSTILQREEIPLVSLSSKKLDLLSSDAADQLAKVLRPGDALLVLSCLPSSKDPALGTMVSNVQMAVNICAAIKRRHIAHVIYLSSDAVYPRHIRWIDENSSTEACDPYSAMHLIREKMFSSLTEMPVAILRSTQIYSTCDLHDAYGPNRFIRTARAEGKIYLFGDGEELRDHIAVSDVAELIFRCLSHRSVGILNIATGHSASFAEIASLIADAVSPKPEIVSVHRQIPITHRQFNTIACRVAFPDFVAIPLERGLKAQV